MKISGVHANSFKTTQAKHFILDRFLDLGVKPSEVSYHKELIKRSVKFKKKKKRIITAVCRVNDKKDFGLQVSHQYITITTYTTITIHAVTITATTTCTTITTSTTTTTTMENTGLITGQQK